jgi:hypothetical protein
LGRGSVVGDDPLATKDPTWQQLTGGGVFRVGGTTGFINDPFGTKLMPAWYDPTMGQKVSQKIGEYSWVIDVASVVAAAFSQPEVVAGLAGLEILVHGTKLAIDVNDEDWSDVPWDVADLVLDGSGLDKLGESITKQVLYQAKHAAKESVLPEVNGKLAVFVAARLKEQLEATVDVNGKKVTVLPASAIAEVAAEAQAELLVLDAAGVG